MIDAFYSDPHFGHSNIIQYANRPFKDREEMEDVLISKYNELIGKNDTVLWTGDCFFKLPVDDILSIMKKLNGNKLLIKGNHDKNYTFMLNLGFNIVMDYCLLQIAGRTCRVSHYPYSNPNSNDKYANLRPPKIKHETLIHGHTHSTKKVNGTMVHVGVDAWDYYPAPISEVEKLINGIYNVSNKTI